jgi:hypothetical protein
MGPLGIFEFVPWNTPAPEITEEIVFEAWLQAPVTDLRTLEEYTEAVREMFPRLPPNPQ